ncbi:hypothetical protein M3B43_06735 [Nesterenkonia massiliensis]|uniref:Uncharacterized protein n=1 Tax=Nesterenkonia massiliensis TaxID=1232429 RepID=A0ABT2HQQ5_9MICC|nr:hypothetical protein [Nesterenkonia massiliensis]MCT1607028.1 hypothetical protein [Nesterenkonia massiliensis]
MLFRLHDANTVDLGNAAERLGVTPADLLSAVLRSFDEIQQVDIQSCTEVRQGSQWDR